MDCHHCEHYRTATKRYVRQVGEIVKHSRECPEIKKFVVRATEACSGFVLTRFIWCESKSCWVSPERLCFFEPYSECMCQEVTELMEFANKTRRLRRIPHHIKTRKYPKVNPPSSGGRLRRIPGHVKTRKYPKVILPSSGKGTGNSEKRVVSSDLTALDYALDAANVHSYLSISADEYELISQSNPLALLLQKERLGKCLSEEARAVVHLIFSSPSKVCSAISGNITKGSLTTYLRSDGWTHKVIAETFQELTAVAMSF